MGCFIFSALLRLMLKHESLNTGSLKTSPNHQGRNLFNPSSWGLPIEAIGSLGQRLQDFHRRYADCFKTKTRDASAQALNYLSGLLRMVTQRNFATIGRATDSCGQQVHH